MNVIERMAGEWRDSGIVRGDAVLLHSRIKFLADRYRAQDMEISLGDILQSFLEAVGPNGSLLFPAFRYDFAEGKPFDMVHSKSGMGVLSEFARLNCGGARTGHPFYSFSVFGKLAPELRGLINRDGFGVDSPFHRLRTEGGKIAVLDLDDQHSMTYFHYVEQWAGATYRYTKSFTGPHIDLAGTERQLEFDLYVRKLEAGVVTDVNPMGQLLWDRGCYKGYLPTQGNGLRTITASDIFIETTKAINEGRALGLLYRIEQQH